jgi:hypothetical protein
MKNRLPRKLKNVCKIFDSNKSNIWDRFDGGFQVTLNANQLFDYSKMLYTKTQ